MLLLYSTTSKILNSSQESRKPSHNPFLTLAFDDTTKILHYDKNEINTEAS